MKPNVIVVGKSGSGKSTSLRNLNPETTAVINTERKQSRSSRRTPFHTFSSNVISQVLRTSPLFDKSGYTFNTYDGARGKVMVWRARTTEEIVEKVGVRKHQIRKTQPKAVKNALETIGVKV